MARERESRAHSPSRGCPPGPSRAICARSVWLQSVRWLVVWGGGVVVGVVGRLGRSGGLGVAVVVGAGRMGPGFGPALVRWPGGVKMGPVVAVAVGVGAVGVGVDRLGVRSSGMGAPRRWAGAWA